MTLYEVREVRERKRTTVAPGEPHLEHVGRAVRVRVPIAELALQPALLAILAVRPLVRAIGRADPNARRVFGVPLGHVAGFCAARSLVLRRVLVEVRLEARAVLVQGEGVPEDADRGVGGGEWERVGNDADGGDGVPRC